MGKNPGFRAWFYFRQGWSTYFAFIFAAINTLTVTYFLAIDNYPSLKTIFPSFEIYILIVVSIGIPLLIMDFSTKSAAVVVVVISIFSLIIQTFIPSFHVSEHTDQFPFQE